MLIDEILDNWRLTPKGYIKRIASLGDGESSAWTIKTANGSGVAIPYVGSDVICEEFTGAKIQNEEIILDSSERRSVLLLTSTSGNESMAFAALCAELVYPGNNCELRNKISSNPVAWWIKWKELLGNKNVEARVYDVLGELCVLRYLSSKSKYPIWNGPNGATYDIECISEFYEVKSTVIRSRLEITISNQFQLNKKEKDLFLIVCQFEPADEGLCINNLVNDLEFYGYNVMDLNDKLTNLGFEIGKSSRNKSYILHQMLKYKIDDTFPSITPSSFIGGTLPIGITKINYTVSLDGLSPEVIL